MIGRRAMLRGAAAMGIPAARPDQHYEPPGGVVPVGQRSGIFRGRLVIIFGPGGTPTGVFVYNGAPAAGNPPVGWLVPPAVTTDPYGNALTGMFGVGNPSGALLEVTSAGTAYWRSNTHNRVIGVDPNREAIFIYNPAIGAGNLLISMSPITGTDTQGNAYENGFTTYDPATAPASGLSMTGREIDGITAASQAGPYANAGALVRFVPGGTPNVQHDLPENFLSTITAQAGTAASPTVITTDLPQAPTFANGWTQAAGRKLLRFKVLPNTDMEVVGSVVVPAGFAAGQGIITAMGANYRPTAIQSLLGIDTSTNLVVRLTMGTGGVLQFQGPVGSTAVGNTIDIPCQRVNLADA